MLCCADGYVASRSKEQSFEIILERLLNIIFGKFCGFLIGEVLFVLSILLFDQFMYSLGLQLKGFYGPIF